MALSMEELSSRCLDCRACPLGDTRTKLGQHRTNATIRIRQQVPNKNCG